MGAEKSESKETRKRQQNVVIRSTLAGIKKKYMIMSGKGGVGKSSLAVNLAVAVARKGNKVGLLDIDLHGPSVPGMLGLTGQVKVDEDRSLIPQKWDDNLSVISIDNMLKNRDDAIIWRGPKKITAIRQFISDVAWGSLDYLFIDSPPGTGDEALTVATTVPTAEAIVVTTPQEISLADVRKAIQFLNKLNMKIAGLVENMSGFVCPHCGETTHIFGHEGGRILAEAMDIKFLGSVPLDPEVVKAADNGLPYVVENPEAEFSLSLEKIAAEL